MQDDQLNRWAQRLELCIQAHDWYEELGKFREEVRNENSAKRCEEDKEGVRRELDLASLLDAESREGIEDGLVIEGCEGLLTDKGHDE